ncbi:MULTISPECIES: hypothetical protein [Microcoleaceae]|nr:hypothetical protein [Tychonema sp. LEGE 06208]MBE9163904.1 hypothetical protein [Tychonema sp. LEGE 06208]
MAGNWVVGAIERDAETGFFAENICLQPLILVKNRVSWAGVDKFLNIYA